MLFNSYSFIFIFMPLALVGYEIASRFNQRAVVLWLGFASLVFYGWWQPSLLIILLGSVALNYTAASLISQKIRNPLRPGAILFCAISLNLLLLGYYKYFIPSLNFFSRSFGLSKHWANVVLPLGISFFTFTQIAFLVDLWKRRAQQHGLPSYLLFVTFFPHLIAGPILNYGEMMPQFHRRHVRRLNLTDLTVGGTWFVLGLAKKVIMADTFADTAFPTFAYHGTLPPTLAWLGTVAYALQLYFDFSGYSDMALGLARMFSIDFPLNFNSPYKSASIIEMWQRWHMTLGRYIFAYIYVPLSRKARDWRLKQGKPMMHEDKARVRSFVAMVAMPLIFTMFLAGIWHGAGVQFIVFGLLNGLYLSLNYAWRQFMPKASRESLFSLPAVARMAFSRIFTYLAFLVSLIFFRADNCSHAISILTAMLGIHHSSSAPGGAALSFLSIRHSLKMIAVGMVMVWALPNTQQILTRFKPSLEKTAWNQTSVPKPFIWTPNAAWAVGMGVLFIVAMVGLQAPTTFLYFQF